MSNWVGFACSYAPYGPVQWRLPLGIQIPWGIILFIGLCTFMPNSPRQLIRHGKIEQARIEFIKIRRELHSHEAQEEFALMRAQIEFEMEREVKSYADIFKLFRHRALVCIAVQTMTSLTGVNVIQYYQTILFESLGISSHMILALAGVYGTIAFSTNFLTTIFLTDSWGTYTDPKLHDPGKTIVIGFGPFTNVQWVSMLNYCADCPSVGRRKMILWGLSAVIVIEIYAAIMQMEFQNSDNAVGKGFAVL